MGAAGALVARGLKGAAGEAIAFESALTKSTTLIGVSKDEMTEMGNAALRLSHTGQGPIDLADALFFVQSAGLRGQQAMDVVEASAKAASIGLGDAATIADLTTSAINAYGSENLTAAQATDILIGSVREGKAEASELAGSMGQVLPIASEMGITFDQVGGAMAAMTRTGTGASEAATQLRSIMTSLLKPSEGARDAMAQFGLSADHLRGVIRDQGLFEGLMMVRNAVGDNEEALAAIFPNVRAFAGVLDLTGASAEANADIFRNMADTTGLLDTAFETWSQTSEAAIARFTSAAQSARIAAMEDLGKPLSFVLDTGTKLLQMFTDLPGPVRTTATVIVAVGAAVGILGGAALLAVPRINATRMAIRQLGAEAVTTRTLMSGMGRFLLGSWGVAIGAAITGLGIFFQQQQKSKQLTAELANEINGLSGEMSDLGRQRIAEELIDAGAVDAARRLGVELDVLVEAALGNENAWNKLREAGLLVDRGNGHLLKTLIRLQGAVEESAEKAAHLAEMTGGAGRQVHRLGKESSDAAGEVDEFGNIVSAAAEDAAAAIAEYTTQAGSATRETAAYGHELVRLAEQSTSGDRNVRDLAEAMRVLGDETSTADEKARALKDALRLLSDGTLTLEEAQGRANAAVRAVEDALDDATKAAKGNTSELFNAEGQIDTTTEAGWRLFQSVTGATEAMIDEAAAAYDLAIANGDLKGAHDATVTSAERVRAEFIRVATQAGLTEQQASDLADQYGLIPDDVHTVLGATDEATRVVEDAQNELTKFENRNAVSTVTARASTSQAERDLNHTARNRTMTITPRLSGGGGGVGVPYAVHTGGEILSRGHIKRYHDGGSVVPMSVGRLAHDEVPAILQTRERVLNREQAAAFESLRTLGIRTGPQLGAGDIAQMVAGMPVKVYATLVTPDGRVLAEWIAEGQRERNRAGARG
nr:phage tail tape measure protein [Phytoactinopolyspora alkaliphila]